MDELNLRYSVLRYFSIIFFRLSIQTLLVSALVLVVVIVEVVVVVVGVVVGVVVVVVEVDTLCDPEGSVGPVHRSYG